jgi:predicted MFS family arabinose efflux permease
MGDRPTFVAVFGLREYRVLFLAQLLSIAGDQLSRVALSVLVFERTASAGLTALAYALTYLPDLVAGPLLSGLADRWPRRGLMVTADIARALLVPLIALPGAPLPVVCGILVLSQLFGAPHGAARSATLVVVLPGEYYVVGLAASNVTSQVAQVAGFALGGAAVAALGVGGALLVDACTFAASAVLVGVGVRGRPAPVAATGERESWWAGVREGSAVVWGDRRLRALVGLACVSGWYTAVEGVAVPYAASVAAGPVAAGVLLAAAPAGAAIGMVLLGRLVGPQPRLRAMGAMSVAACVPLLGFAAGPGPSVAVALLVVSGVASAYQLTANAAFVQAVPDARRGQAFGLAVTALQVAQGTGIAVAGAVAHLAGPAAAITAAGAGGVVAAAGAWWAWHRASAPAVGVPR